MTEIPPYALWSEYRTKTAKGQVKVTLDKHMPR
jgi:hypothetical protein